MGGGREQSLKVVVKGVSRVDGRRRRDRRLCGAKRSHLMNGLCKSTVASITNELNIFLAYTVVTVTDVIRQATRSPPPQRSNGRGP